MNRTKLKNYAPQARRDFIQAMTDRAAFYGLTPTKTEPVVERGDVAVIAGREHPRAVAKKRKLLEDRIHRHGFGPTMEALAYTWFNRLVAVRYMELHGYLDHGYRVLSHPEGKPTPEIVEQAEHVELPGLKKDAVIDLKLAGNKEGALYRLLLTAQCNALHTAMPFLFERIDDETELLLPDNLLNSDSLIRKLVGEIEEEDWKEVEIIGWLYQFYISAKKDEVIGKVVASEDIPAATQLFTPNWIVKYLVQNTLGRQWLATYPQSALRQQMAYYIEPAEQTPEVQAQLKAITPTSLNPEELTLLDPACGSGHILVEGYDLFKAIYTERGYNKREIPRLILEKNLFGLEIDDRAVQLAAFALMMKARSDDRRIFDSGVKPNVVALQESDAAFDADTLPDELTPHSKTIEKIVALFRNAKTFGSLIKVPTDVAAKIEELEALLRECLMRGDLVSNVSARRILELLSQLRLLARRYDTVVANPPYMGSLFSDLKEFAKDHYPDSKSDLFSMFMDRGFAFARQSGCMAMVTMQSWMFLKAFQAFRETILEKKAIATMAHLGPRAFPEIAGEVVQTTAFACYNCSIDGFVPKFFRLVEGDDKEKNTNLLQQKHCYCQSTQAAFKKFPGTPLAYWLSDQARSVFDRMQCLESLLEPQVGLQTSNNGRFLRLWHEVDLFQISFNSTTNKDAEQSGAKWFPLDKGGSFRRWYGNNDFVVNWKNNGQEIKQYVSDKYPYLKGNTDYVVKDRGYFFRPGVTWNKISSGSFAARVTFAGAIFSDAGMKLPCSSPDEALRFAALLNSCVAHYYLTAMSPTLNVEKGAVARLPVVDMNNIPLDSVRECVRLAKADWDFFEESYDFAKHPFLLDGKDGQLSRISFHWEENCNTTIARLQAYEAENNAHFIQLYGLEVELSSNVMQSDISLYHPDRTEDFKRLLSYAIGCMMGRYSLDKPGLVYAHSGSQGFDSDQYKTFRADDDGIIPLLETDWGIRDDATSRFVEFVGVSWPKEHLEENLKFVADSLGTTNGEQPRDTIRRYLATGFYKHHLSMYKKRPIYWLFTSGKLRAFQCLVYLHRYNEGTLARMRTEYVIPLQGQIASRIDQLDGDKAKATSTSHRKKLQKEQDDLKKQQAELLAFEEKLKHAADQKIVLDLDDGVKVNYGKFGDLLAEAKAITGGKDDE